jgi:phosphate transport system permease protein
LQFKSWVSWQFITSPQSSNALQSGIRTAIIGSLWVTLIAFLLAVPLGAAAAIYLEEYNTGRSVFDRLVETNINNLAGVPSIIYGMLGLAVFVRFLGPLTSGLAFGYGDPSTANGRTIVSAGLTLGLLILPLVIINAREAIRAVPRAMREGSYGLGATRWQTVWHHVLPSALPGILTGVILSVSRAFGETAPLIVVGVSTFVVVDPDGPFSKFTTLPAQIYQWTSRPQQEFQHLAAAAILVLLVLLLLLNAFAIWLRNRYSRRII